MSKVMILLVSIVIATNADNQVDLDDGVTYQAIDNKYYKVIDGLVSNEWVPLTSDGYVDDL